MVARKTEEFLDHNVGYLTGTHTGGGKLKYTRASASQIKDLAQPKASPRASKQKLRSEFTTDKQPKRETSHSSLVEMADNPIHYTKSSSGIKAPKAGSMQIRNPIIGGRTDVMDEFDSFIKKQLKKDPQLPELQ